MPDEAFSAQSRDQIRPERQLRKWGKKKSNGVTSSHQPASPAAGKIVKHEAGVSSSPATPKITVATSETASQKKETPSLILRKPSAPKEEAKADETPLKIENQPFDGTQVEETWAAFKEERLSRGATDTEKLVLNRKLIKAGENNLKIYLESQLEISILEKFETDMIRFFRSLLGNTLIQIEKEVSEQDTARQLYTSKEKFEYMAEQNPTLRLLKDRLGLDFEY